ncbi:hypothetical protein KAR91_13320, partial [Candidatus Pacearchaeota archaeon]|nr:hypothetical protein [Candidatus Pacearchaeota archaeon]
THLATNLDELPAVQDTGSTQTTIENLNQTALQEAFQTSAVIAACRAFAAFDFESRDKAIEARDSITLRLSELAENASDTVYGPLVDLRSAISTHLLNVAQALPQVVEIILQEPQPSVVVMYDIYGNLDDETDFLIRNKIENPAAVPALKVLEVLADG